MEWLKELTYLPSYMIKSIYTATLESLYMVGVSSTVALFFGTLLGIVLSITKPKGLFPSLLIYQVLGWFINLARSFPFIILIILLLPLSKLLIGQSYGTTSAIIPLSISAIPFVARLIESALDEVDDGVIEALQSVGTSPLRIVFTILHEALPSIINAVTITIISVLGYSAIAGAIGAGGLGDLAIRIGYQSFMPNVLFWTVIVIIVLVQSTQTCGDLLVRWIRKNR